MEMRSINLKWVQEATTTTTTGFFESKQQKLILIKVQELLEGIWEPTESVPKAVK